ncbi:heme/hemin ABC transporter substrate-binding protein [Vibrio sp. LaRot3]|uniref:heme/hemin ABC transporter substrate-binding protein n=1 Tax=Vibrio sp. LaRot3 TaxID=2998829 RepID=UPI0022CE2394|nr:ABC transporter substrate-binding protein [Vibrio sp. LaRot3]MDA0150568.1 ABC transporter substrate-binding protein [Vibrio sp. LaRot3]
MKKTTLIKGLALASLVAFAPVSFAKERIISAGAAVTELMIALGQQDQLIAVDVTSQLPDGAQLPKVGYHRQLSAEGLLAMGPTKLVGSDEMGPDTALAQLKSAGVSVDIVNTEATPEGLLQRVDQIAKLTHSEAQAAKVKQDIESKIELLNQAKAQQTEVKKVLFLLIHEGRPANVAGSKTTPNAIIELAGGINPAANQLESYKPLSVEAMLEMQPDVILVSGRSYQKMGSADAILKAMPMLSATPAGKTKNIVTIDGHALVGGLGLKSLEEAQRLSAILSQ